MADPAVKQEAGLQSDRDTELLEPAAERGWQDWPNARLPRHPARSVARDHEQYLLHAVGQPHAAVDDLGQ